MILVQPVAQAALRGTRINPPARQQVTNPRGPRGAPGCAAAGRSPRRPDPGCHGQQRAHPRWRVGKNTASRAVATAGHLLIPGRRATRASSPVPSCGRAWAAAHSFVGRPSRTHRPASSCEHSSSAESSRGPFASRCETRKFRDSIPVPSQARFRYRNQNHHSLHR